MKRILYAAILAIALLIPEQGTDIGELRPVGLIQIYKEGTQIWIVTDTGDSGWGESVDAALQNLKETTPGTIYLDTADYLLVSKTAIEESKTLGQYLNASTKVCLAERDVEPVEAAEYLKVHEIHTKVGDIWDYSGMKVLEKVNSRLILKDGKEI